jgi:outer membrane protein X
MLDFMNNAVKRVAIVAIAVTMSVAAGAQEKGDMAAGGNLVLGTGDSFSNFGIGAKFQYSVTDPVRLEGSFTYFLKKDYITMWDLSVNGHYLFKAADKLTVYPLAGLCILNYGYDLNLGLGAYGVDDSASTSDVGFNFGGGLDYELTDKLSLNAELKYKIAGEWNRLMLSAGIAYKF